MSGDRIRRPVRRRPTEPSPIAPIRARGSRSPRRGSATPLAEVAGCLRCPNCGASLIATASALACADGHRFDVAREGHVSLDAPGVRSASGDTAEMVAARAAFLAAGHYRPIAEAVLTAARTGVEPLGDRRKVILDLGAGPGYHLAFLLGALPNSFGLALDASPPAVRRAAKAHPNVAAIRCDAWHELPLKDASVPLAVNVFAPRNASELARVVAPGGTLVVAIPTPRHLEEIVGTLGLLRVESGKEARLHAALPAFAVAGRRVIDFAIALTSSDVERLVSMGPSAWHLDRDEIRRRCRLLPSPCRVTASVSVQTFRRR